MFEVRDAWWLSRLSVQLLISARVMVLGPWDCALSRNLFEILSLSLCPSPAHVLVLSVSQIKK